MHVSKKFLEDKARCRDLVLLQLVAAPLPQVARGKVERVYSARHGIDQTLQRKELNFVCAPDHWGQTKLQPGERALVFLSTISGKLYEDPWRGHIVIEVIDGVQFGMYKHKEL